jgi:hypothetical protein
MSCYSQEECDIQAMKIFKEFNRRRGISDKVRRVEETSSHVTKRGEEGTRLQARDLDSLLGKRLQSDSVRIRILFSWRRPAVT